MGNWNSAYALSAKNEGNISTDKNDTGNIFNLGGTEMFVGTRYGQTFENWIAYKKKKKPTTKTEFESLKKEFGKVSKEDVKASFKAQYWDKYNLDKITDDKVASNIYDAMINQSYTLGGSGSHKTLSDVLNSLGYETDAKTSFDTNQKALDAINKAIAEKGGEAVNTAYSNRREESYMGSKTVDEHGKGWLKRLNEYRNEENQYSQNELNEMSFTNDSTSNMAVLDEIRNQNINVDEGTVDKGSEIKNKDNLDYLKRRASEGGYELSDEDNKKITDLAEEQRVQWSKLGKPGLMDLAANAFGVGPKKLGVDDDMSNAVMRQQVIESLSSDINVNTPEGKKQLRQRLKSYTDLIGSDEYKDKVASLSGGVRDSSYENMIEDISADYRLFINDANEQLGLEGSDAIGYEIKSEEHLDKSFDEEGVISDNKAILQQEIDAGNQEIIDDVAKNGMDAVAADLAGAQADAASRGEEADAATLLALKKKEDEMSALSKSLTEGVKAGEAIEFDEEIEEEDDISALLEEGKKDKGKEKTPLTDEQKAVRNKKWMQAGQAGLGILKAAAGIKSLSKALQEHKVDVPELSPLLTEAVNKQRELSKAGFTAQEKASAMTNINNAYASAMKNVLRASGGQRGAFLANQGVVDANRVGALVDLAAKDAAVRRQNIQGFNQLASSVGQMQLNRDMTVEQMKQQTVNQNKQLLSGIGTNLLSGALDEASYYLNPNRKAMDEMTSNILQSLGGGNSGYDPAASSQANITAASQQNAEK
tara:strand:+ start:3022 stop:5310 length:2289 start_codon:yes stop_codon:yes gene_type:complete